MSDYDPYKTIIVVGYPRSGNTWLTRLIAQSLDSPFSRFRDALPIGTEGQDRPGDWLVTQLHLRPVFTDSNEPIIDGWQFNVNAWKGETIVFLMRDPRDVAISAMHYWDIRSIREAILTVSEGKHPMREPGPINSFNNQWWNLIKNQQMNNNFLRIPNATVQYEFLYDYTERVLKYILSCIEGAPIDEERIKKAIIEQEFDFKKNAIEHELTDGTKNARPYGKTIQLKTMYKGYPGQWREEMSEEDKSLANHIFAEALWWMGYPKD